MSVIKIELFDPSAESIKRYDDKILKDGGLISCVLYNGKRKIRGIYTISDKYIYGDSLFIIDPSEKDLIGAIGFDAINCDCNENDLKKETGITIRLEILKVKKSKILNEKYKKDIIIYSSEEIENSFLTNYVPPEKSPIQVIQEWWSAPIWVRVLTLVVPLSLLATKFSKFLTTRTIKIMGIIIVFVFGTPIGVKFLLSPLEESVGSEIGKILFWIIAANLSLLILFPLVGAKKIKGSKETTNW